MKRLAFTPTARDDLMAIGLHIAEDDPARALSFMDELEAKARQTAERPRSFPARDDIGPGLRAAIHARYLLLFRELGDEVRIIRIVHGARPAAVVRRLTVRRDRPGPGGISVGTIA